jgi:threonine dehydrogenase-like Zn-dependent dehydrogenase
MSTAPCKLGLIIQKPLFTSSSLYVSAYSRIPESMSFEEAAMCEPLSVALQACERTNLQTHDRSAIIFGAGAIGLLVGAVAKAQGLQVVMFGIYIHFISHSIDIDSSRLEFAREFCAHHVVLLSKNEDGIDPIVAASQKANHLRETYPFLEDIDLILECTGAPVCLQIAIFVNRSHIEHSDIARSTRRQNWDSRHGNTNSNATCQRSIFKRSQFNRHISVRKSVSSCDRNDIQSRSGRYTTNLFKIQPRKLKGSF